MPKVPLNIAAEYRQVRMISEALLTDSCSRRRRLRAVVKQNRNGHANRFPSKFITDIQQQSKPGHPVYYITLQKPTKYRATATVAF